MRPHVVEGSEGLPALFTREIPRPMNVPLVSPDLGRISPVTLEVEKIAALFPEGGGPLFVSFIFLSLLHSALPQH